LKSEEIRVLSDGEIQKKIDEADLELLKLGIRATSRQLVNHRELVRVKKRVARMKTILRERNLGIR
jgi:large subunit ribosomal protein L29